MTIFITGASKGIGYAIAAKFLTACTGEIQLAICARNAAEIEQARSTLARLNSSAVILAGVCDVADETSVKQFIGRVQNEFGAIDVLVNNAGFGIFKTVSELTAKEFDDVIATNLRGVFLITQAVLPAMRSKKAGTIITISSLAGKNGFATASAYCAAKFGVRGLMQSLFLEVREDNIRVVTICPGSVDTDFFTADTEHIRSKHALEAADVADAAFMVTQLPQNATISELDIRPTNPKG
jgi:3-oxoacyl-[acyl-carrier protein] reductase